MRTAHRITLTLLCAWIVLCCDWLSKPLAETLLGEHVITNDKPALVWALPLALGACLALSALVPSRIVAIGAGMLAGGWSANLVDRMLFGPVVDFIPFPAGYVGNLADLAILAGAALLAGWLAARRTPLGGWVLKRA